MRSSTLSGSSSATRVAVGLVQINNSFSGQNYLPYSSGCLRAYVEAHASDRSRYEFLPMIYKRLPIGNIVDRLEHADIVGFSTYVWNANASLEAASRLKARNPDVVIVFGGPQVPDKPEAFLRAHPFIDLVVHNEGERSFLQILERLPDRHWDGLTGISYMAADGSYMATPRAERMKELAELPSPFLHGAFDELVRDNPQEKWIGLWETNRGCPFQCTFCDWGSATAAKVTQFELDRLFQELQWFVDRRIEYLFVCDANFGMLKRDIEIAECVAKLKAASGYPQGFSVQSTKNATERAYLTQKILADAGLNKGVALSMQSLDSVTLKNIKRDNISLDTYLELSRRFTRDGIETYSDLILGLPGETYDSFIEGVDTLINSGQHNRIQFNNLSILPNAEMGDPESLAKYQMVTVRSEIINIHGAKEVLDDDVPELQDVVISTYSMNTDEWRRVRAAAWMIAFVYFDKLVQIPIVLLHERGGLRYQEIFERFMSVDRAEYPTIGEIRDFFLDTATSIQSGGPEYVYSEEWLAIYWPADEYAYIRLCTDGRFGTFYAEVERLLRSLVPADRAGDALAALADAVTINHALVSRPGAGDDTVVQLSHNVIAFWRGICAGQPVPLVAGQYEHVVRRSKYAYQDVQQWCREVVWWGNKKGAYLYPISLEEQSTAARMTGELAGHY